MRTYIERRSLVAIVKVDNEEEDDTADICDNDLVVVDAPHDDYDYDNYLFF